MELKKTNKDSNESEQKRLQSINEMVKNYQQQKLLLKEALSSIDVKRSNKIIFDDDIETDDKKGKTQNQRSKKQKLFEDDENCDDGEDTYNFDPKTQFEGKDGQQLFELQSRYKGDKRFTLDERFIEQNHEEENHEMSHTDDVPLDIEKKNEMQILNQVLATKSKSKALVHRENGLNNNKKGMLRFDPTQHNHLIQSTDSTATNNKVKAKKKKKEEERNEEPQPEVSKDVFYKVDENLKNALEERQQFSLISMFGKEDQVEKNKEETDVIVGNMALSGANPFRYDSSDDEETEDKNVEESQPDSNIPTPKPVKFWSEPFFIEPDDFRLQEGSDFVKRIASEEKSEFVEQRKNLKHIVRAKIRKNERKNTMFKKKLGGNKKKKMLRIKKAMKR